MDFIFSGKIPLITYNRNIYGFFDILEAPSANHIVGKQPSYLNPYLIIIKHWQKLSRPFQNNGIIEISNFNSISWKHMIHFIHFNTFHLVITLRGKFKFSSNSHILGITFFLSVGRGGGRGNVPLDPLRGRGVRGGASGAGAGRPV